MAEEVTVTAGKVKDWIREIIEQNMRVVFNNRTIHVSEVTGCLRKSYYNRKLATRLTELQQISILFGNGIHHQLQELLRGKGWVIEYEVRYNFKKFELIGHVDAYNPKNNIILEIKSTSKAPEKPYEEHVRQINAYLAMTKSKKGYIIYITKNGRVKVFPITFDKKLWDNTIKRAFYLFYSLRDNKPPKPEPSILCKYCPWKWRCYKRKEER